MRSRTMTRGILAGVLALSLTGCAGLAARGVTYGLEGLDAAKNLVDEKTDRREALRRQLYSLQDSVMTCYATMALIAVAPDCAPLEEAYRQAEAFYDGIYPDLAKAVGEIQEFRQAVGGLSEE